VITIDGPAASGKSTTAKLLAGKLGYIYLDTGAMYRAMALKVMRREIDPADQERLRQLARETEITVDTDPEGSRIILDGEDVTDLLRNPAVTRMSSVVSAIKAVRERMVELQREIGAEGGIVTEGRDMGSVVFPRAEVKIYLDADLRCRAARRKKELEAAGKAVELETVESEIKARDQYDSSRQHSPLVIPDGAVIIDTTDLTVERQVARSIEEVRRKLEGE
jgi:cytidylate kinase